MVSMSGKMNYKSGLNSAYAIYVRENDWQIMSKFNVWYLGQGDEWQIWSKCNVSIYVREDESQIWSKFNVFYQCQGRSITDQV